MSILTKIPVWDERALCVRRPDMENSKDAPLMSVSHPFIEKDSERVTILQFLEAATRDQENTQKVRKLRLGLEGGMFECPHDHFYNRYR